MRFEDIPLRQLSDTSWEIPRTGGMLVAGLVFASPEMLEDIVREQALHRLRVVVGGQHEGAVDLAAAQRLLGLAGGERRQRRHAALQPCPIAAAAAAPPPS